ncbi:TPA: hypothetical protein ACIVQF_004188 [Salmonella enterica subsp. enterica serovar Muenchen]
MPVTAAARMGTAPPLSPSGDGRAQPDTAAEYPAGFFFCDSLAVWSAGWRLMMRVGDGSSPTSLQSRLSLPLT